MNSRKTNFRSSRDAAMALLASLALTSVCAYKAEAFQNRREFLWNKMLSCQGGTAKCQEVHTTQPSQCVKAPNGTTNLTPLQCDASYVITLPDASNQRYPKQTLLVPGSASGTTSTASLLPNFPVTGIEAYKSSDGTTTLWLPNYFAYAASFALTHYRGAQAGNWVVVAMNSANMRTQDQLHLHMCNLNPGIKIASPPTPNVWTNTGLQVQNHAFYVMKLSQSVRATNPLSNPFTKVFLPEAPKGGVGGVPPSRKADVTLALVIAPTGINYLLYNLDGGAAESLLPQGKACDYKP